MPSAKKTTDKKKGPAPGAKLCANCDAEHGRHGVTLAACARCHLVLYCSKTCQATHWKANHSTHCIAKADRKPPPHTPGASTKSGGGAGEEECAICLDPLSLAAAATLPCGHVFHPACVEGLRSFGCASVCPLCRADLPSSAEQLFEDGAVLFFQLEKQMGPCSKKRGDQLVWAKLSPAQRQQAKRVVALWRGAGDQGDGMALFNLAKIHLDGRLMPKPNPHAALKFYKRAAEVNYKEAQSEVGYFYYTGGLGTPPDYAQAAKWFERAAVAGDPRGMGFWGTCHVLGHGTPKDPVLAATWLKKGADAGDPRAQVQYAGMSAMGALPKHLSVDGRGSLELCLKSGQQGDPEALLMLYQIYSGGAMPSPCSYVLPEGRQPVKAVGFLTQAANMGYLQAQIILDKLTASGNGDPLKASGDVDSWAGQPAKLHGLVSKPELNGCEGTVVRFHDDRQRYEIRLKQGGDPVMVKPANMRMMSTGPVRF